MSVDSIIGIFSILIGGYWAYEGIRLGWWDRIAPGAGFLPLMVGVLMVALGIALVIRNWHKPKDPLTKLEQKWIILMPMLIAIVVVVMEYIGAMLSLSLFLIAWFIYFEKFSLIRTLHVTFWIMLVTNLIFVQWLDVPFPKFFGVF